MDDETLRVCVRVCGGCVGVSRWLRLLVGIVV